MEKISILTHIFSDGFQMGGSTTNQSSHLPTRDPWHGCILQVPGVDAYGICRSPAGRPPLSRRSCSASMWPRGLGGCQWKNQMGVSKNRGTPKWMVKIMENPIEMDDLDVSKNRGTPRSTIFKRVFHYFHHPFWGYHHLKKHPNGWRWSWMILGRYLPC